MNRNRYAKYALIAIALVAVGIGIYCVSSLSSRSKPPAGDDLRRFAESYFRAWSERDMAAYRSHFDESARIMYVEGGRVVEAMDRDPFVAGQAQIIAAAKVPMVERMTSFAAEADGTAAHVTAQWELTQGDRRQIGVDRFTLLRNDQGQWKIVFLMFYTRQH